MRTGAVLGVDEVCSEIPPPVAPRRNLPNPRTDVTSPDVPAEPVIRLRHRHRTWNHEVFNIHII